jgi:hypothetical protein
MEVFMADNGSSGMGVIAGVLLGIVLVVGGLFFFANGGFKSGDGPKVTVNTPSAPSAPTTR